MAENVLGLYISLRQKGFSRRGAIRYGEILRQLEDLPEDSRPELAGGARKCYFWEVFHDENETHQAHGYQLPGVAMAPQSESIEGTDSDM